jgi:uncharacterized protein YbjQ (UPF0145 family)
MLDLYILLALVVTGYLVGQFLEKRHYRSIYAREAQLVAIPATSSKRPIGSVPDRVRVQLVEGACVISVDYFKRFVARLRQLFGGNVRSYETLVDRARREAILRLKESCTSADQIINLRIETSSITKGQRGQVGAIEIHAYATALYFQDS